MAAQSQVDPILTWAVLIGMILGGLFGAWVIGYRTVGPALITAKKIELYPLTFFSEDARFAYDRLGQLSTYTKRIATYSENINYQSMWGSVVIASKTTGNFYRKAVGVILIGLAIIILFTHPYARFKNRHTLESLLRTQAISWPVITPFIKYNPATPDNQRAPGARVPLELPIFSEALYPEEWMAYHRIRIVNGVPDRDQIRRALLAQLGDRFDGLDNLPEHLYCLLAAFALKGARKRKECDDLLGEIAKCWTSEGGFKPSSAVKSTAARTLNDGKIVEPLLEVMNRHAYVATAFLATLAWARRQGGVLAPAQFVWLRGEHRDMWYPLNNMGRRAFHVEAAGAMAHYQAEVESSRALTMPRLDAAVVSIVQYISETRARIPEIEGGERDQTKKLPGGRSDTLMLAKPTKH